MSAFMYICAPLVYLVSAEARRRLLDSPGTGVTNGCVQLCGYLELNLDLLQEQQALLTTDPFLQPPF